MSIDDLLNQPLAAVRDDGFAVGVVRRLLATEQRMRFIMWGLLAAGFLPVLAVLPFVDTGIHLPTETMQFLNSQMAYPLGVLVLLLLWVWKPRFSRL
jgi:hypothetical protein